MDSRGQELNNSLTQQNNSVDTIKGETNIATITNMTSTNLKQSFENVFCNGDQIVVNASIINKLDNLITGIGNSTSRSVATLIGKLKQQKTDNLTTITTIDGRLTTPTGGHPTAIEQSLINQKANLLNDNTNIDSVNHTLNTLSTKYKIIFDAAKNFNVKDSVSGLISSQSIATTMNFGATVNLNIKAPLATSNPAYTICNEAGKALDKITTGTTTTYKININGKDYTIGGITGTIGNPLDLSHVTINPTPTTYPLDLNLSITGTYKVTIPGVTDEIEVVHKKPLNLSITEAAAIPLNRTAMETQYASLNLNELIVNTTPNPTNHKEYEHRVDKWEEECLEEVLSTGGLTTQFDRIKGDATLKEILIKRMKERLFNSTSGLFSHGHVFANNTVIQDTFKAYVTDETIIDKENRKNQTCYKTFLTANYQPLFKDSCKKFITGELSKPAIYDELNKVFSKFLQDESDGKFDNAQFHLESLRLLDDARTNTTNNWRKNPHSFGLGVFNHLRYNYSNLICGESREIKGQTFKYTDNGKEKSTTYNLNLDCKDANHFELNITIQGEKDPLNFVADTPDKLMHAILKTAFTKDREPLNCKLRVKMVLDALKALMMMCPGTKERKDYHVLERNCADVPGYERLRVEKSDSGKLRIVATHLEDAGTGSPKYVAKTKTLFDEDTFMQLNDISLLEEGLGRVAGEITRQLNNKAKKHKKSIDTGITRRKSEMSKNYQPVTFFRNIFNLRKDTDFSFQTTTQSGIEIQFDAKKNRWTLRNGDYSITKKDIGKILQDKHFNGKQFEIISAINKAELKNMYDKDPSLSGRYFIVNDASTTGIARKYIIHGNELYTLDALVYEDKDSLTEGKAHEISLSSLPGGLQKCNDQEKENFFTNPVLVGRMIKCMKGKLKFRTKKKQSKK